ncbi:hypothetical protein V6N12_017894 [Hibiscus sabdariffa]|uniref:Aldehyde dehydrogenase domain-containing protein n=1 Tax=Hibiscus sabdariffa TaxID=183260 RepID=A0ABR2BKC3_9ROSI
MKCLSEKYEVNNGEVLVMEKFKTDKDAAKWVDGLTPKVVDRTNSIKQVKKLYKLFYEADCSLLEINSLPETSSNQLVDADANLNFNDNFVFCHKYIFSLCDPSQEDPREVATAKADLNYMCLYGEISCMVNGAGLAMATMHIIKLHGGTAPKYFDVDGNASDIGDALLASPHVRKITFTGSTTVGKRLMAGAAGTVKRIPLEPGGNAPCIVFDDVNLDVAVKGVLAAKFYYGQTCVCANKVIVNEGIYEKFAEAFSKAVQNLQVGDGFTERIVQDPLINEVVVQRVESFLQDALSKGAKVIIGGKRHSLGMTFYEPTIVTDVKTDMLLAREEVFGPMAPFLRFKTEEEAIRIANDTNAGLIAYIFTSNVQRTWRVSEALEYDFIGVNEGIISTEVAPFGNVKQSGLGRRGSKYGIDKCSMCHYEVVEVNDPYDFRLLLMGDDETKLKVRTVDELTCRMQKLIKFNGLLVGTLKLQIREIFKDHSKRNKVVHGVSCNTLWIQLDSGIYWCNLVDTK